VNASIILQVQKEKKKMLRNFVWADIELTFKL
jgi:hypothetical protein